MGRRVMEGRLVVVVVVVLVTAVGKYLLTEGPGV